MLVFPPRAGVPECHASIPPVMKDLRGLGVVQGSKSCTALEVILQFLLLIRMGQADQRSNKVRLWHLINTADGDCFSNERKYQITITAYSAFYGKYSTLIDVRTYWLDDGQFSVNWIKVILIIQSPGNLNGEIKRTI